MDHFGTYLRTSVHTHARTYVQVIFEGSHPGGPGYPIRIQIMSCVFLRLSVHPALLREGSGHNEHGKAKKCKQTTQRLQVASAPLRLNRFITKPLMAAHGRF